MHSNRRRERPVRGDSGEATLEWATIAFAVMVAAFIVASLLMNKAGHYGTSLLPTLTVAVGVTIVIAAYTWALTVIGTTLYDRR